MGIVHISYDLTCDIETAEAVKAQKIAERSSALPLKPISETDVVLSYFWVDNFDVNVEKQSGGGAVNTTHLVAFQEKSEISVVNLEKVNVKYSRSRSIESTTAIAKTSNVAPKKEPPSISSFKPNIEDESNTKLRYFLLGWLRFQNRFDQILPNFPG